MHNENTKDQLRKIVEEMVRENPDILDSFMDMMLYKEDPAYYLSEKAIKLIVYDENYHKAINIINMGLRINDTNRNFQFYKLRGECKFEIDQNSDWLADYQNAIDSVSENDENRDERLSDIYINAFEILIKINDFKKAEEYINNALSLADGIESSYYKYKCLELRSALYKEIGRNTEADEDSKLSKEYERRWNAEEEANPSLPY